MSKDLYHIEPMVIDFETSVIPNAAEFIDRRPAPRHYKDKDAITRKEEQNLDADIQHAALDVDLARIVAAVFMEPGMSKPAGWICRNEDEERKVLRALTKRMRSQSGGTKTLVGHNILDFDVPLYDRRCLYLDVPCVEFQMDRFRHPRIIDLMQELSFNGKFRYRSLDFWCRRFGIDKLVPDAHKGSDVPRLVTEGRYDEVLAHCKADVEREYLLAVRLGVIPDQPTAALSLADSPF